MKEGLNAGPMQIESLAVSKRTGNLTDHPNNSHHQLLNYPLFDFVINVIRLKFKSIRQFFANRLYN